MRVPPQLPVPGMQDRGSADAGAESSGIGADDAQRPCGDPEQDVEDRPAVLTGDTGDRLRKRDDDMEAGHRQDGHGPFVHPPVGRGSLAVGAVAVGAVAVGAVAVAAGLPYGVPMAAGLARMGGPSGLRRSAAHDTVYDLRRGEIGSAGAALAKAGHRMIPLAEHGAGGSGVDPCRFRGPVAERIPHHTGRRSAFMRMRCSRVPQAMEGDAAIGSGQVWRQ